MSCSRLSQQQSARERWVVINVEACQSQLHNIIALRHHCEVALCCETKLTAGGQKAVELDLSKSGWKAIWGDPCVPKQRRGYKDSMWDANNGGVAVLIDINRPAKRCMLTGSAARYEKEGRLLLTAISYGNCRDSIYAMTIYGYTGAGARQPSALANNEALLTAAFEALATLGSVPVLLGGDFNTDIEASDVLRSALGTGQYYDVIRGKSHQLGVEPDGTQKLSGNRLDCMLFNKEAFAAFCDGGILDEPCFPVHVPVYSGISFGCFKQQCRIRHVPAQIPRRQDLCGLVNQLTLTKTEVQSRVNALHLDAWRTAVQTQDVDILFQIWCERA